MGGYAAESGSSGIDKNAAGCPLSDHCERVTHEAFVDYAAFAVPATPSRVTTKRCSVIG